MGRTMETKGRILEMLSCEKKNLTELCAVLGLSPSTVSQHLHELKTQGAIYLVVDTHFRRYKYYKAMPADRAGAAARSGYTHTGAYTMN